MAILSKCQRHLNLLEKSLRLVTLLSILNRKKKRERRFWVRKIFQRRSELGDFATLFQELKDDREQFFRYTRMSLDRFNHHLILVKDKITKQDTKFRKSISAEERLAMTLRFLASDDNQQSISFSYRVGKSTASKIIAETCEAIYLSLKDDYLASPKNE